MVQRMSAACRLCKRDCVAHSAFCKYHLAARKNLESAYKKWAEAYDDGSTWRDYLLKIKKNTETGQWAREVAGSLLQEPEESSE